MKEGSNDGFAEVVNAFQKAGLLRGFDSARATEIIRLLKPVPQNFTDQEFICRSNDDADRFWVITSGELHIVETSGKVSENHIYSSSSQHPRW